MRRGYVIIKKVAPAKPDTGTAKPKLSAIDWQAVRRRLRLVRAALDLSPEYVEAVVASLDKGDEAPLIAFARKHGQSLEWIITGDLAPMLRKLARAASKLRT